MKIIAVIGGSGFIGSALARLLTSHQKRMMIVDTKISKFYPEFSQCGDVRSVDQIAELLPAKSVIINLAAEHRDKVVPKTLYEEVNVSGAINICTAARIKKINTIIFTSSVAVYGFAKIGTNELGEIAPFNEYGRTKYEAERIYRLWQEEAPDERILVIIRPTVVFGEGNRGNVYSLFNQIATGRFVMIGNGENRKSMAYVENVAAFIEHCIDCKPGIHIYNYVDKPDFTMNRLVGTVNSILGKNRKLSFRVPYGVALQIAKIIDIISKCFNKEFAVSAIRIQKFCSNSVYDSAVEKTGFKTIIPLEDAIVRTIRYEFIDKSNKESTIN